MSTRDPTRIAAFLQHIIDAAQRIAAYTADMDQAAFEASRITQDAVIRNLEIIGEASNNIARHAPEFAELHGSAPWAAAYQMRNVLAHAYDKVDLPLVWQTLQRDIPNLRNAVAVLLDSLNPTYGSCA